MGVGRPVGIHALLDFYGVAPERLTDAGLLAECLCSAARAAGMTPLSAPALYHFPGGGLTGYLPLAESHIAMHTYPERGYLAADVFTCGSCGPEEAIAVLRRVLLPVHEQIQLLPRGYGLI